MAENERQQRLIERVLEDERLRGDLEDAAATALVEWASQHVASAAADPARPDAEVEAEVQAIRAAARSAARSGESEPQRVIELANAALGESAKNTPQPQPSTTKPEPAPEAQPRPEPKIVLKSPDEETTRRVLTETVTERDSDAAPAQSARIVVKPNAAPEPERRVLNQTATEASADASSAPAQPSRIVVKPNAPPAAAPAQPAQPAQPAAEPIADTPPTPSASEPAQPAAPPPQRRRISFWRRWSPFAGIWNRFRGNR